MRCCGASAPVREGLVPQLPDGRYVIHFACPLTLLLLVFYFFSDVLSTDNDTHTPREDYLGCSCGRLACSGALYSKAEQRNGPVQDFRAAAAVVVLSIFDLQRGPYCAALPTDYRCQALRVSSNKQPRLLEELRSCVIRTMGLSLTSSAFSTVRLGRISQERVWRYAYHRTFRKCP